MFIENPARHYFSLLPALFAVLLVAGCDGSSVGSSAEITEQSIDTSDFPEKDLGEPLPRVAAANSLRPERLVVPGLIEAEFHASIGGTSMTVTVPSTEAGVGQAVIPTAPSTRYNYALNVTEAGIYDIRIRYTHFFGEAPIATLRTNGRILLGSVQLSGTGSSENFQDVVVRNVRLNAGLQTLGMTVEGTGGAGTRINWLYPEPVLSQAAAQHTITVDPVNGSDGAGNSLRSLPAAFNRVAEIIAADANHGPIDVILEEGYHELTQTLLLNGSHAGTMAGPVRVKGRSGAYVRVGGGRQIDAGDFSLVDDAASLQRLSENARGKVYRVVLDDSWDPRFPGIMSYNDERQEVARFPNIGYTRILDLDSDSFKTFDSFNADRWAAELETGSTMYIRGHIKSQEFIERDTVAAVSDDGRITFSTLRDVPQGSSSNRGPSLYIYNVLAELDTPGEFYYDQSSNELFLWPVTPLSTGPEIRIGGHYELINGVDQAYIRFENIHFQDTGLHDAVTVKHMVVLRGKGLQIVGNDFRNGQARASLRLADGHSHLIRSNDFYDAENAFISSGIGPRTLPLDGSTFSNARLINNHIHSTLGNGYGGIGVVTGVGGRFQNNLIHNVQGGGTFTVNSDGLYELNEAYDSGWENGDWNIFYHAASYALWGNVMRYNFFHNIVRPAGVRRFGAVRTDDGGQGVAYTGNIFYKTGDYAIAYSGGGHTTTNNIAINTESLQQAEEQRFGGQSPIRTAAEVEQFWELQRNCVDGNKRCVINNAAAIYGDPEYWLNPSFRYKYPVAASMYEGNPFNFTGSRIERNLVVDVVDDISGNRGEPEEFPFAIFERPIVAEMSIFRDPDVLDFSFNDNFQRPFGFRVIPFDRIGLFTDGNYRERTPHKKTYRADAKLRWQNLNSVSRGVRANPATSNNAYYDRAKANTIYYDLGTYTSPLFQNHNLLTNETTGSYGWSNPQSLRAIDRGAVAGVNTVDRDLITARTPGTFEMDVDPGAWYVRVTLGDALFPRDQMSVSVEGERGDSGINTDIGQFINACAEAVVNDGRLSVTISDDGGNDPSWTATRIIVSKAPFGCSNRILPGNAALAGQ